VQRRSVTGSRLYTSRQIRTKLTPPRRRVNECATVTGMA
jgi:hypothetical protein